MDMNTLDELDAGDEIVNYYNNLNSTMLSGFGDLINGSAETEVTTMSGTTARFRRPMVDPNMELMRFVCEVVLSFPIAVLGIIGNLLAFIVLCNHKQKLTTTVLLQALAVADTLVLISSILLRCMRYIGLESYNAIFNYVFLGLYPCVYFFRLADTWLTVLLTIDRFIAVCYPLHAQRLCTLRRTYISMAAGLVGALLFNIPRFFEFRYLHPADFVLTSLVIDKSYVIVYRIFLFFLFMYLVPMILLIVLNTKLVCTLRRASAYRAMALSQSTKDSKRQALEMGNKINRSVTTIVVTVVLVCISCNVIAMATHIVYSLQLCFESLSHLETLRRYLANITNVMVTVNCAINFGIYCMCSRNFRSVFARTFMCASDASTGTNTGTALRNGSSKRSHTTESTSSYSTFLPLRVSFHKPPTLAVHKENGDIVL